VAAPGTPGAAEPAAAPQVKPGQTFKKGDCFGFFQFGGSAGPGR
jgi:hypothetical protein